jgi:hypothetical protein
MFKKILIANREKLHFNELARKWALKLCLLYC